MDLSAIKQKLQTMQQSAEKSSKKTSNDVWKPTPGTHQIRIVPYIHNKDNPFIELFFHYNIGKKTYLSPVTHGNPDPILEFAERLKLTGSKEDWLLGRKLEPKLRTYVPILIRGQESEGVKFWGFGNQVYQELLSYIADDDYGDITDPIKGRDIIVEIRSPEETGKTYQETNIRIKPKETKISEDPDVITLVKQQKNISEIFKEYTYDELKIILDAWMNPSEESEVQVDYTQNGASDAKVEKSTTKSQIEDAFDDLFK